MCGGRRAYPVGHWIYLLQDKQGPSTIRCARQVTVIGLAACDLGSVGNVQFRPEHDDAMAQTVFSSAISILSRWI